MKINKEVLCNYCRVYYDMTKSWNCGGCRCEEITEKYLEEIGIEEEKEEEETHPFKNIRVGDKIYILDAESIYPGISVKKVKLIKQLDDGQILIKYESSYFHVDLKGLTKSNNGNQFLNKKDCEEMFEKLCLERILHISKLIGSVNQD